MTPADKRRAMHRHLLSVGIAPATFAPPAWRLLWRLGVDATPPLFVRFAPLAVVLAVVFGSVWSGLMWVFLQWLGRDVEGWKFAALGVCAGLVYGLAMAAYFRSLRRRHRLPEWDAYAGAGH